LVLPVTIATLPFRFGIWFTSLVALMQGVAHDTRPRSVAMTGTAPQRVALVTGGAVRVGRAISLGLADDGWDLVVAYHSSAGEAERVAREVEASGRRCVLVRADLSRPEAADSVVDAARDGFGRLDLVVNSAASFRAKSLLDVDAAEWDSVMSLNARAPHLVVRAAADLLRASRGSVVNIVDLGAFQPWLERPHHAVSKAALAHLTRIQAGALAPDVRVNAIAPGAVLRPEDWSEARWSALAESAPLQRAGTPNDVVGAVLWLASAGFVTGQVIAVDGGRLLLS
jgi:NAD(P)-dependent dehydrogenase (short-subunit alcohol dehydrogenase family)